MSKHHAASYPNANPPSPEQENAEWHGETPAQTVQPFPETEAGRAQREMNERKPDRDRAQSERAEARKGGEFPTTIGERQEPIAPAQTKDGKDLSGQANEPGPKSLKP